jgi:hypothetical protein
MSAEPDGAAAHTPGVLRYVPRLATLVVAFFVGAVYGLAGTIAHAYRLGWFPLGLVLAIIGSAALLAAVRLLTADRWAALASGIGMIVATLVFSGTGPGGSVIVEQTDLAIVWTVSVPVLVVLVVAWPNPARPVGADGEPSGELD